MKYASYIDERYDCDAKFRMLVDSIYQMIITQATTPTEVREAVLLAQLKYEMNHPRPIVFSQDLLNHIEGIRK